MLGEKFEKYLWLSDLHIPYHDNESVKAVLKFSKDLKPDTIILGGDIMDFYSVSQYDKDPSRINKLQKELDEGKKFLGEVRRLNKKASITYLIGNHESRLLRWLRKNPELWDLSALQIPALLELEKYNISFKEHLLKGKFLFKHGDYCTKYVANKELDVEGISGMSGHKHTNQMISKNTRAGYLAWYSIGHLSDEKYADYIVGVPNWQQGIAVIHFKKHSDRFHVTQIPIVKNKFLYADREYGP